MLWLILFVLCIIGVIISFIINNEAFMVCCLVFTFISAIFILPLIITGIFTYSEMVSQKQKIETLESNISLLQQSYNKNNKDLDLENMQISVKINEYLQIFIKEKADYNSKLTKIKLYRQNKLLYLTTNACFMDKNIDTLKIIE